jgi:hypothetical protein
MAEQYMETDDGFAYKGSAKGGENNQLTSFLARVTQQIMRDDGTNQPSMNFIIEGSTKGRDGIQRRLPTIEVPAADFPRMTWVTAKWGNEAVIYSGPARKEHTRVAIQLKSGDVPQITIYTHMGWRKTGDGMAYLHAGGALGCGGNDETVRVDLGDGFDRYRLPDPPRGEEQCAAVRASLRLVELTVDGLLGYVLLAAVYRAVLAEACIVDFSLFLTGGTGVFKSEVSALALAHYGAFDARSFVMTWEDSEGALERNLHAVKDAVSVIDDYHPTGTQTDRAKRNNKADRVLRGAGNQAGRARLTPDIQTRPTYYPRGLIITSGEDVPTGHSLRARILVVEMERGTVQRPVLTGLQRAANGGVLRAAMAAYIVWLAPRMERLHSDLPQRLRAVREEFRAVSGPESHARGPANIASLWLGLELFFEFAEDTKAIIAEERAAHLRRARIALLRLVRAQGEQLSDQDDAQRFIELIGAALESGRAYLRRAHIGGNDPTWPPMPHLWGWSSTASVDQFGGENWVPRGEAIGWLDGATVLLEPEAAFAVAQRFGHDQGQTLSLTRRNLWKRLAEQGLCHTMRDGSSRRSTVTRVIGGRKRRVLAIDTTIFDVSGSASGSESSTPEPEEPQWNP